jgi:hypothetical protein
MRDNDGDNHAFINMEPKYHDTFGDNVVLIVIMTFFCVVILAAALVLSTHYF